MSYPYLKIVHSNSPKLISKRIRKRNYITLGPCVINSPMSSPSLIFISVFQKTSIYKKNLRKTNKNNNAKPSNFNCNSRNKSFLLSILRRDLTHYGLKGDKKIEKKVYDKVSLKMILITTNRISNIQ